MAFLYRSHCIDLQASIENNRKHIDRMTSGEVAPIKSIGTVGGAEQVELPMRVDWLEDIGILKEIK